MVKELDKSPIVIKTLNTRVDTARDLVLKLYNTTNDMIKYAKNAELSIVFANRYRSTFREVDEMLTEAEKIFYKGDYREAYNLSLNAISLVDKDIIDSLVCKDDM